MGFPNVTDFQEGVRGSAACLYRRWDGTTPLPPGHEDLSEFLDAITISGEGWLPNPDAQDVGMAAERLRIVGVLSSQEHFMIVEPTDGNERLSRLTDAIRRHLGRDVS